MNVSFENEPKGERIHASSGYMPASENNAPAYISKLNIRKRLPYTAIISSITSALIGGWRMKIGALRPAHRSRIKFSVEPDARNDK